MSAGTTHAYLLRRTDYRDADRIVTLFTPEHGKVSAVARSARSSRRRFAGSLEPFSLLQVELKFGRSELGSLKSAQLLHLHAGILANLQRVRVAGEAMERLRGLVPDAQAEPTIFGEIARFFDAIEVSDSPDGLGIAFAFRVLSILGSAPELDRCVVTGTPCGPGQAALFDPSRGGIVRRSVGGGRHLLSGTTREKIAMALGPQWFTEEWEEKELAQASKALEGLLLCR